MIHLSRSSLSALCLAAFVLAGAGWLSSWKMSRELEDLRQASPWVANVSSKATKRERRAAEDERLLRDPRSARLLSLIAELDEAAKPGEPNPRFLKAAALTLDDSAFQRRKRDFSLLLEKMTRDDAVAIHQAFAKLERSGRPFSDEHAAFATRWGEIDGAGAMAYFSSREPFDMKPHELHEVMVGWGSTRPEEALEWIDTNKGTLGSMNAYSAVVAGWLQKDPAAATGWLSTQDLSREEIGDCLVAGVLDKLYSDGMEGMSEWLASLPDDNENLAAAARQGWNANQYRFHNLDPEQAAAAWSQVGDEPWMGVQEFGRFCEMVARANHGDLEPFLGALSHEWPAGQVSAQFERWAEQDPGLLGMILNQSPPSEFRTAGIKRLIAKLEPTDPGLAAEWQQKLANESE